MSFLAPLFLMGLLAVAIPIAIHLIRRDKPQPLPFSSLRFFRATTRKQFLFQSFQQWLLLALRALALCLLAFAFARPFFSQTFSGWVDLAPRSIVLAIDTSMSMGYENYLLRAKQEALNTLNELKPGDEVSLIFFSDEVKRVVGPSTDVSQIKVALDQLVPDFYATRFFAPLVLASELLNDARFDDKALYLISDFQANGMEGFDESWKLKPGVNFIPINVGSDESRNLAITGIKAPSVIRDVNAEQELFARVRSLGNQTEDSVDVSLEVNGVSQQHSVNLAGQSEIVVPLHFSLTNQTQVVGEIKLQDKYFTLDNSHLFSIDVLPKIPILVVNGEASENWYDDEGHWFSLAVGSGEQTPFAVTVVNNRQLTDSKVNQYDVVVLLNVGDMDERQAKTLRTFVRAGGSLLLAPGDRVHAAAFNRQFADISPATLVAPSFLRNNEYLLIADVETRHPILQPLELDWAARFDGHWSVKPADNADVLMRFDNGDPALVERSVDAGRTLVFTSSLDLEWNNLPLQGMYLPFVHEMLKHLSHRVDKKTSYVVGDVAHLPRGKILSIEVPNNEAVTDETLASDSGSESSLTATSTSVEESAEESAKESAEESTDEKGATLLLKTPGFYRVTVETTRGIEQTFNYAVNPPIEESNLLSMDTGKLFDLILNPETKPTQSAELRTQILKQEIEKPQRVWWWILLSLALLLMAEVILANRTYR